MYDQYANIWVRLTICENCEKGNQVVVLVVKRIRVSAALLMGLDYPYIRGEPHLSNSQTRGVQ